MKCRTDPKTHISKSQSTTNLKRQTIHVRFIGVKKALDTSETNGRLEKRGVRKAMIETLKAMYRNNKTKIKMHSLEKYKTNI